MDFFAKHYEKLILAFCLVLLIGGIAGVVLSTSKTSKLLIDNYASAKRNVEGGNMVELMKTDEYSVERYYNDSRKMLAVIGNPEEQTSKGSMFEPNKMIVCANSECKNFLLLKMDICPFCNEKEPELSKATGAEEDTDSDGVPDLVEQNFAFMNYRDPTDARKDQDRDGFLNIEEIKAGTNPDDAADFPPLSGLLRLVGVRKVPLRIELIGIEKNRSEDVKKWDVDLKGWNAKERKYKRAMALQGDVVFGRFKVTSIGFEGEESKPYAVVVPEDAPDEEYKLVPGEEVYEVNPMAVMIYLRSRDRSEVERYRSRMLIPRRVGVEFPLSKRGGENSEDKVEYYKVVEASFENKTCKVGRLDGKGGAVVDTFDVPLFNIDNEKDFLFEDNGSFGDDMSEPGAEPSEHGRPNPMRRRPPRRNN